MKLQYLTVIIIALLSSGIANALEFDFTYKGQTLKYKITAEKEVSVETMDENISGDVEIPSEVEFEAKKYKVSCIGDEAFTGCGNIKSVVIPNTVTHIGAEAFSWSNIHVVIPGTVTSIGGGAFYGSKSFRTFDFAYEGHTLRYEVIAENEVWVACRGDEKSYNISGELKIPSEVEFEKKKYKVTRIGQWAFGGCSNLKSVIIPNSVMSIEVEAFAGCGLQNIVIPNSVKGIGSLAFAQCHNLQSIVIPNSVISVGELIFRECSNLQSIFISESVASFDSLTFKRCPNLSEIEASPSNKRYSSKNGVLYSKSGDTLFVVPGKTVDFTIPNTVKCIGNGAFAFCDSFRSVTIPNSVTSIGNSAFLNCRNLQSVFIPNSVTSFGKEAFGNCQNLQSVTIPNSLTYIGEGTFANCQNLQSVVIPNSIKRIEDGTFWGCRHMRNVSIPNSVTSIGRGVFSGCSNLTNVVIPNSVKSIGKEAFANCDVLWNLTIEAKRPPIIGERVFYNMYDATFAPAIYVPAASVEKYKAAEGWKKYADKIQPIK